MIDVSEFQGGINWIVLDKTQKVLIRATMGAAGVDAQEHNNFTGAENHGFTYGGYMFLENSSPSAQVDHFLSVWHPRVGNIRGMIDVETSQFSTPTKALTEEAVSHYHAETGHYPILYGSSGTLDGLGLAAWMIQCPLMLADYGPDDGAYHPINVPVPKPWHNVAIHQYTSKGRLAGITANTVDMDKILFPSALLIPRPRPIIDKWQISYMPVHGKRTRVFTRAPVIWQTRHKNAKYRGALYIYPHRKEGK